MNMKTFLATAVIAVATTGGAAENILLEAAIVKHPASMVVNADDWLQGKSGKGVEVVSRPRVMTWSGQEAKVAVGRMERVGSGAAERSVIAGPEVNVRPTLQGETVSFTGSATIRERQDTQAVPGGEISEFMTRECLFAGSVESGGTFVFTSKGVHEKKRISVVLRFTKL
jgi:hypothetical protein